ncbi:HNH endonuclease [Mycobacterium intracellulare]|uniref:HNH endonuclease n=1 Tax=Mycobacterium intracellulare TaxID=1767 RepID=UPI003314917E
MTARTTLPRNCRECGTDITHRHGTARYCSNTCKWKAEWRNKTATEAVRRKTYRRVCAICGKCWESRSPAARFCSIQCQNKERYPSHASSAGERQRRWRERNGIGAVFTSGACRICKRWFISRFRDVTCSTDCWVQYQRHREADRKQRRAARKRDAFVSNVSRKQVFESDGYRCHLCGRMTDRTKKAPHPKAPTIDHLIPLAAGGKHEPTNCRTAHFMCNSLKSDRGSGEQHVLFV